MTIQHKGFSMMELMIAMAIVAVLSLVALPSYKSYVNRQKVVAAQNDLVALAMNLENYLQQQLTYPTSGIPTATTAATQTAVFSGGTVGWNPAQGADFKYLITATTSSSYTITAVGTSSAFSNCTITLTSANSRTLTSGCGGSTSWF